MIVNVKNIFAQKRLNTNIPPEIFFSPENMSACIIVNSTGVAIAEPGKARERITRERLLMIRSSKASSKLSFYKTLLVLIM